LSMEMMKNSIKLLSATHGKSQKTRRARPPEERAHPKTYID